MTNTHLSRMRILPAAMLLVCCGGTALAQINSLNSDIHAIIGARAAAVADAYAGEAYDASTIYWNPAGLSFVRYTQLAASLAFEVLPTKDVITTENVAVPLPRIGDWAFGIGGTVNQIASIASGSPLQGLKYSQMGFDFGVSKVITTPFSVGASLRARYAKNNYSDLWAFSGSLGVFYAPVQGFTYGAMATGFGSGIDYPYDQATNVFDLTRSPLRQTFQGGLSMRYPLNPVEEEVLTFFFTNEKVKGVRGLVYKIGMEIYPWNFLVLRGGYWTGPVSAAAKWGTGVRLGRLQIDYALAVSEVEPIFHQFTLSYNLPSR